MLLSMKWLSEYIDIDMPVREFTEVMTMSGSKVERYDSEGEEITGVVVGRVLSVNKHQGADSLVICSVDIGREAPVQIVTGADNVTPGALVPVATDGSTLPRGVKIKKGKLRGEISEGMLCSLSELGVTVHDFPDAIEDGIFIISEDCEPGADIHAAIGLEDTTVEFEITSNRPDCMSVLGLAREAGATLHKPLSLHKPVVKSESGCIGDMLSVDVQNAELCPRYVARMVKNIKIAPSPRWLRERLRASGVRPINNIVDITNYVMLEYGQPMHAFDYRLVRGGKIIVRNAAAGESITTLDEVPRPLTENMLVIADGESPTAIAGVMGGEYSCINPDTNTIVFESANFFGPSVRTTSKKLGMRTESSARFEKGLDAALCLPAVTRACELIELLGAGEIIGGVIDVDNSKREQKTVPFTPEWINAFIGIDISPEEMTDKLHSVGFSVENGIVSVPSYRADIETRADISEEIARLYGYNNIPTTGLRGTAAGRLTERQSFERKIVSTLLAQGLSEIITYSFISPKYYDKIRLPQDSELRRSLVITNPLGEDTSVMRSTTLPSMLEVVARNYNNRNSCARLFELGTEYIPTGPDTLPIERQEITLGCYSDKYDFFALKGVVETLLRALNVPDAEFVQEGGDPTFHPGRCARLIVGGEPCGVLGELHPAVLDNYSVGVPVYAAKLDVTVLFSHHTALKSFKPLPKFPASSRDLALLCDESLPAAVIQKTIAEAVGGILETVSLFDVYQGAQIEAGKKSIAYSICMRADDRTLTDEEADAAIKRALKALSAIGAVIRE